MTFVHSIISMLPEGFQALLIVIGIFTFTRFVLAVVSFVKTYFLTSPVNLKRYGEWAIVTGATDGIGRAVADELAKKGMKLVLVSRTQKTLETVAEEIKTKFNVESKIVAIDFQGASDPKIFKQLEDTIASLDVGVLINNVGVAYDHAEFFGNLTREKIQQLINLNIYGTTFMTHIVLQGMEKRKRGAIINISSMSSLLREPMYAVYTGTKAYVDNFSWALHYEYKSKGIFVQSQIPALVTSKLSKVRKPSFFIPSPSTYAKTLVRQIGQTPVLNWSYWPHYIQSLVTVVLPESTVGDMFLKRGLDIRKRALNKKAETEKNKTN